MSPIRIPPTALHFRIRNVSISNRHRRGKKYLQSLRYSRVSLGYIWDEIFSTCCASMGGGHVAGIFVVYLEVLFQMMTCARREAFYLFLFQHTRRELRQMRRKMRLMRQTIRRSRREMRQIRRKMRLMRHTISRLRHEMRQLSRKMRRSSREMRRMRRIMLPSSRELRRKVH